MWLTRKQANALVALSVVLLFVVTPYLLSYAFEYRLVEQGTSEHAENLSVPYDELSGEEQAAVDRAIAGDGPWYRTRGDAPTNGSVFGGSVMFVERGDRYHRLVLEPQFHWQSHGGRGTVLSFAAGVVVFLAAFPHYLGY